MIALMEDVLVGDAVAVSDLVESAKLEGLPVRRGTVVLMDIVAYVVVAVPMPHLMVEIVQTLVVAQLDMNVSPVVSTAVIAGCVTQDKHLWLLSKAEEEQELE